MATTSTAVLDRTATADPTRTLALGGLAGMVAGMVMAMVAMVAAVTYQHHGFFTPLFHISALTGSPQAMMTSMQRAMAGQKFWFTPGAALAGLVLHMTTGALYGMLFAVLTRTLAPKFLVVAGAAYGIAVLAVSSLVLLPIAAAVTGSGDTISHMARMVGWSTFALEHLMFGMALGVILWFARRREPAAAA